jgi:pimeloyl-ACP methyl ester carboxylesterase
MRKREVITFTLVPGAGGQAWYWHRLQPLLVMAGHEAVAVDLPAENESFGLEEYADLAAQAIGRRSDVVLVCQSLAGFLAPLICARAKVRMIILVNAMIPNPGEIAGSWWEHTGAVEARISAAKAGRYDTSFTPETYFLHDVPERVMLSCPATPRQANRPLEEPCQFERWPAVSTRVIAGASDRFFPVDFQRRVAWERLGTHIKVVPGGHLVALSRPQELSALLIQCVKTQTVSYTGSS